MLNLRKTFDLHKDVFSHIWRNDDSTGRVTEPDGRIHNVERDGGVLYSWKETPGTTRIGKYDLNTKEHKLLYVFDEEVFVTSCSLNKEETLLAVTLSQMSKKEHQLRPASKFLTLLMEIQPVNNTKVLKAMDSAVTVQFLHPEPGKKSVTESHLLLIVEDGYVEQFQIPLTVREGYRVVIQNPERLAKDRVAEDLNWAQWDVETQRLFYVISRERALLKCLQFYPDCNCETVFELPVDLATNPFSSMRLVNLGYDHHKGDRVEDGGVNFAVFTSKTGSMCVCYSQPLCAEDDVTYTVLFVHRGGDVLPVPSGVFGTNAGHSRTYTVSQREGFTFSSSILFFQLGYYIVVYLADCFLHLINVRQQDLPCYSLFLSGANASLGPVCPGCLVLTHPRATFLDPHMGRMYRADFSSTTLLQLLRQPGPDAQRLAALHCLLAYVGPDSEVERQVIDWICESVMPLETFDQIQEFILASLFRTVYQQASSLDSMEVLPYSSVFEKKDLSDGLKLIPGVKFTSELLPPPVFQGKVQNLQGYWEELQWNTERVKYFDAVPNPRFRTSAIRTEWTRLQNELKSERTKPSNLLRNVEENARKVLSSVDTWQFDKKVVPLFHNEDHQQRALIGLMVDKLREHMNRHLPRLGKRKIEKLVVSYTAKLLNLVRHMLEAVWAKYRLELHVLSLKQRGSAAEWAVFHVMTRVLEATSTLCLPLPPGYHTLLAVLGLRCLPRHTFLQYVDHGLLQLTEPFVLHLMTDLDNSPDNEELKFSLMKRLPEPMEQKMCQIWDHPIMSARISRNYVKQLLEKHKTKGMTFMDREQTSYYPEFLPLTYLAKVLSDVEGQGLSPFEGQENVDARFVEETALKQTMILLGLEDQ